MARSVTSLLLCRKGSCIGYPYCLRTTRPHRALIFYLPTTGCLLPPAREGSRQSRLSFNSNCLHLLCVAYTCLSTYPLDCFYTILFHEGESSACHHSCSSSRWTMSMISDCLLYLPLRLWSAPTSYSICDCFMIPIYRADAKSGTERQTDETQFVS